MDSLYLKLQDKPHTFLQYKLPNIRFYIAHAVHVNVFAHLTNKNRLLQVSKQFFSFTTPTMITT